MRRAPIAAFLLGLVVSSIAARAEEALSLEGQMALPGVAGRIDHMAVDPARKRLLVAELGNGTLDVVDLASGRRVKQVAGLHEPQGVGYAQKSDLVVVASAGDGSVRFFRGEDRYVYVLCHEDLRSWASRSPPPRRILTFRRDLRKCGSGSKWGMAFL